MKEISQTRDETKRNKEIKETTALHLYNNILQDFGDFCLRRHASNVINPTLQETAVMLTFLLAVLPMTLILHVCVLMCVHVRVRVRVCTFTCPRECICVCTMFLCREGTNRTTLHVVTSIDIQTLYIHTHSYKHADRQTDRQTDRQRLSLVE